MGAMVSMGVFWGYGEDTRLDFFGQALIREAMTLAFQILEERINQAIELACNGKPQKQIIEALGCSRAHFFKWKALDPSFAQRLNRARAEGFDTIADDVLTLVDDDLFGTDPQTLKLKADNMKWYLGVMNPSKYGLRTTVTLETVDIGSALTEAKQRATVDITPPSSNPLLLEENNGQSALAVALRDILS